MVLSQSGRGSMASLLLSSSELQCWVCSAAQPVLHRLMDGGGFDANSASIGSLLAAWPQLWDIPGEYCQSPLASRLSPLWLIIEAHAQ